MSDNQNEQLGQINDDLKAGRISYEEHRVRCLAVLLPDDDDASAQYQIGDGRQTGQFEPKHFRDGDTVVVLVLMPDGVRHEACRVEPDGRVEFDWPAIQHGLNLEAEKAFVVALCRALMAAHEAGYWAAEP